MEDPEAGVLDPEAGVENSSPPTQSATTATLATFFGGGNDTNNPIGGLFSRPAQAPKYAVVKSSVDELIDGETGSSLHVSSRLFGDGGESSAAAAAAVLASIEAASVVAPVNVDLTSTFFGGSGIVSHEIERLGLPLRVLPDLASDASRQVTLVSTSDLFADEAVEEDEEEEGNYGNEMRIGYEETAFFDNNSNSRVVLESFTASTLDSKHDRVAEDVIEPFYGDFEGRRRVSSSGISNQAASGYITDQSGESSSQLGRSHKHRSNKDSRRLPTPGGAMDFFKTLPRSSGNPHAGWDVFSSLPSDAISGDGEDEKESESITNGIYQIAENNDGNIQRDFSVNGFDYNGELLGPAPTSSTSHSNESSTHSTSLLQPLPPWETKTKSHLSSNLPPWEAPYSTRSGTADLPESSIAAQPPTLTSNSSISTAGQTAGHSILPPWEIGVTAPTNNSSSSLASTSASNSNSKPDSTSRPTRAPWEETSEDRGHSESSASTSTNVSNAGFNPSPSLSKPPTNAHSIGSQKAFVPSASAFELSAPVSSTSSFPPPTQSATTATPEVEGHLSSGVPPRTAMQHPGLKKKTSSSTSSESAKAKAASRYFNPSTASAAPVTESSSAENYRSEPLPSTKIGPDVAASASFSSPAAFAASSSKVDANSHAEVQLKRSRTSGAIFGFGGRLVMYGRRSSSSSFSPSSTQHLQILSVGSILESSKAPFHAAVKAFPGPLSTANAKQPLGERSNPRSSAALKDSVLKFLTMLNAPPSGSDNESDEEPGLLGGFKGFRMRDLSFLHSVLRLIVEHDGSLYQSSSGQQSLLPGVAKVIASALLGSSESIDVAMKTEQDGWVCKSEVEALAKNYKHEDNENNDDQETKSKVELQIAQQEVDKALCSGDRIAAFEAALSSKLWTQAVLLGVGLGGAALGRVATMFSDSLPSRSVSRWVYPSLSGDVSIFVRPPLSNTTLKTALTSVSTPAGSPTSTAMTNAVTEVQQRLHFCRTWRSRLALLLLNGVSTASEPRTLITLGDRVWAETGSSACAHALYIIAGATIEPPSPHARVVLVGADHRRRLSTFLSDARSIQRSEVLEYALLLRGGSQADEYKRASPVMQPLKLVYAMALADSDQTLASRASVYLQSIDAALKEVDEEKRFNPMFLAELSAFSTRLHVHLGKIPPPPAEEIISSRELQEAEAAVISNKATADAAAVITAASISVKSASDSTNIIKPQPIVEGGKVDQSKSLSTQNSATSSSSGGGGGGIGILSSLTGIIFRRTDSAVSSTVAAAGPKVVKHAHLAKTNAPQPYFDDKLKRWVFPGEETAAAPGQVAPPTSSTSNAVSAGSSTLSSAPTTTSSSAHSYSKEGKSESSGAAQVNSSSLSESLESTNGGGGGTSGGGGVAGRSGRSGRSRYVDTLGTSSLSSLPTSSTAPAPPAIPTATAVNPFVNRPSGSSAKYSVFAPPPPPAPTQQELEEAEAERKRVLEDELEALRKSQAASTHVQNAPQTGGAPQANINAEGVNQLPPPSKSSDDDSLPFAKVKPAPPEIDF